MRGRSLLLCCALSIAAFMAFVSSSGAAGRPLVNVHTGPVYDSFSDELCGISGTAATRFVGNFTLLADGTFLSIGNFREVFTANNGKQLVSQGVEQVTGPFNPTTNRDGTITETFAFKGLPVKLSLANGPTLLRDAGSATVAITFLLNPDGSVGDVVAQSTLIEHGPHPSLDDGSLFCSAVTSALS